MTAPDFISELKHDRWNLFSAIPEDIKVECIELMDESMMKPYTFIFEMDLYKKVLRSDIFG